MGFTSYDLVLSNPPFGIKWNPDLIDKEDERFNNLPALPPKDKADYAFIYHVLYTLNQNGVALVIDSPGILSRIKEEALIRKDLVEKNVIDSVILMPRELFYRTKTGVCILVLRKNKKDKNILFVDATSQFTIEKGNKELSDDNINQILRLVSYRETIDSLTYLATPAEIEANEYNLAVNTYVKINKTIQKEQPKKSIGFLRTETVIHSFLLKDFMKETSNINPFIENNNITEIISNANLVKLEDVTLSIKCGLNRRNGFSFNEKNPYYYISSKEICNGSIIIRDDTKKIDKEALEKIKRVTKLEQGDILFTLSEKEIKTAIINGEECDYGMGESIYIIKPNLDKINPKYLRYILESNYFISQVNENTANSKILKINITKFRELLIPDIPLELQNKIATELEKLEKTNTELIRTLNNEIALIQRKYQFFRNRIFEQNKTIDD